MRRLIIALCLCLPATGGMAATSMDGRWEGFLRIPGKELPLIVDLASGQAGAWRGSIIIPGLSVNGAPLDKIAVADTGLSFVVVTALANATYGPVEFRGALNTEGGVVGDVHQAGNVGSFAITRSGPAQVQLPPRSTAIGRDVEGPWIGEIELGGYPRQVTITFANHDAAGATATFVVVGKRTTELPVDLVLQEGDLIRIESQANQVAFEGRLAKDGAEVRGTIEVGSQELPLTLRRAAGGKS